MPVIARSLCIVMLVASVATAQPRRVLVVDGDSELVHAIETSLAPWKLVVIAQNDGVDPSLVASRAIQADAQFIVWREGTELVVYDRGRDVTERRPAKAGTMDPVAAAGAALTVKTMMRLPDPDDEIAAPAGTGTSIALPPPVTEDEGDVLRIAASVGIDTEAAVRGMFGAMYRPTAQLRVGGAFELASQDVEAAGFKGRARDYSILAVTSWTIPLGSFELEPWFAAGVTIDVVDGQHAQEVRHETAVVPTARAGFAFWWWHPLQWGLGLTGGATFAVGTPTYTRDPDMPTKAVFYDMPTVGGTFALVAAWRH